MLTWRSARRRVHSAGDSLIEPGAAPGLVRVLPGPGFRIEFDARTARVLFLFQTRSIDEMSIGEFRVTLGVRAVRRLLHGATTR